MNGTTIREFQTAQAKQKLPKRCIALTIHLDQAFFYRQHEFCTNIYSLKIESFNLLYNAQSPPYIALTCLESFWRHFMKIIGILLT